MKKRTKLAIVLVVLALLGGIALFQLFFGFSPTEAKSIGVIGGADGPTAIIVSKTVT